MDNLRLALPDRIAVSTEKNTLKQVLDWVRKDNGNMCDCGHGRDEHGDEWDHWACHKCTCVGFARFFQVLMPNEKM